MVYVVCRGFFLLITLIYETSHSQLTSLTRTGGRWGDGCWVFRLTDSDAPMQPVVSRWILRNRWPSDRSETYLMSYLYAAILLVDAAAEARRFLEGGDTAMLIVGC